MQWSEKFELLLKMSEDILVLIKLFVTKREVTFILRFSSLAVRFIIVN